MAIAPSVMTTADAYIRALYQSDSDALCDLFAESARLYSSDGGDLIEMSKADYIEMVAARTSPEAAGHEISGHLVSLDTIGADKAVAKISVAVPPKQFIDFLLVVRVGDDWKIVSKVYHVVE